VSLVDTWMHAHEINIQAYSGSGGAVVARPAGGIHRTVVPAGIFPCGDRHVLISCVSLGDWGRLAEAMGRPELATDPRYDTNEHRVEHRDEVIDIVKSWLAGIGDHERALELLSQHQVASALILTVAEAMEHPHNLARQAVRTVSDELWGEWTIPGVPIRLASVPEALPLFPRELGADNAEVLGEVLGLDEQEVGALTADGVLQQNLSTS
jgi:crotonobetainyl-CoA:carnitine CoA-transferase CaiB-like acyl-CoA transferase